MNTHPAARSFPLKTRRAELRFRACFDVTLHSARGREALSTWDVSFRGLYLVSNRLIEPRQLVRLSIKLPTLDKPLILHGVVTSMSKTPGAEGRPMGMGLELFAVDRETRALWWDAVRFARDNPPFLLEVG